MKSNQDRTQVFLSIEASLIEIEIALDNIRLLLAQKKNDLQKETDFFEDDGGEENEGGK